MPEVFISFLIFILVAVIFELLRRKTLREKYAVLWIFVALLMFFGAFFKEEINMISRFLGFQTLSNFLIVLAGVFALLIIMPISLELGKIEDQNQKLAEEVSLLKNLTDNT